MGFRDVQERAAEQAGYFTAVQAREWSGWAPQHLSYHVREGNLERLRRGIYRLARYPHADDEELVVVWLWSEREAVFSHQTALVLHGLSDLTMSRLHITLPSAWKLRRMRWPHGVVPHYGDLRSEERTWIGNVPATAAARAIADCADDHLRPDELAKAIEQGLSRGLFSAEDVAGPQVGLAAWMTSGG